ncbi:MAG TPA: ATP-binding protein [Candidatus Limnocylindria bacterium]|nr:ATP-binding protein [Candidatus Limnocylindria bacterium]
MITPDAYAPPNRSSGGRRQWEAAFSRHSDVEFRKLLEQLPAGAYTCDADGLITYYNERAVELWGREPKLNNPADRFCGSFRLYLPDGTPIDPADCWMGRALREDRAHVARELVVERPDGGRLTVLAHANPLHDDQGRLVGAVNVLVDITERKRVEERLREDDAARDQFLAMLAHELRNPLAPMHNALQIMRLAPSDATAVEQARGTIERQLAHLTRVVDELIDVSRVTRNRLILRRERVDLAIVVQQAIETCAPIFDAMEHELQVTLSPEPVYVHGDPLRLSQILTSLLSNAAKYTRPNGRVWLTVSRAGEEALITVRDTGIGIRSEELPRVFDLFSRTGVCGQGSQSGLGIGLTLARGLAELHGGSIEAFSEGEEMGSEFRVRLPVISGPSDERTGEEVRTDDERAARTRRVLVVDDNADAADSLAELLELVGNEARTARDGESALATARSLRPDVILLDIGLPGMSGHDVARAIRAEPWGRDVLLIALTGWGQAEDRARSSAAGFDHHLVKPVNLGELEELIATAPVR